MFAGIAASHSGLSIAGVTGVKEMGTRSFARPGPCVRELPVSRNTSSEPRHSILPEISAISHLKGL